MKNILVPIILMIAASAAGAVDTVKPAVAPTAATAAQLDTMARRFAPVDLRADAFLSNDYLASDFAWMDLDSPVDVTIGPYETYNDEVFGYKAAFEA